MVLKCITVGILCAQFLLQFYIDQFETLKAHLSWSVDVHVVVTLSSIKNLLLFSIFERSHFCSSIRYDLHKVKNG